MTAPYRRVRGGDPLLDSLQRNTEDALRPLREHPFADGALLSDANGQPFALVSGQANRIEHGLQRRVRWMLVSPDAEATVYELPGDETLPERFVSLRTSADVNAFLFVFPA